MFPLIYVGLAILYFYVVVLVVPSVKRGVGPSPPPIPWSGTLLSRKITMTALLWEWIVYFTRVLVLTPKLVSQHVESAQPPEQITYKVTNEELERIVEQAGERSSQSRVGKPISSERATSLDKSSLNQQCRAFSPCKERRSVSTKKGSRVVSFPPDAVILSGEEKDEKRTEMNTEQNDNKTMEGNIGTKNEFRPYPQLKLPPLIFEDHQSDCNTKGVQGGTTTANLDLTQKYKRQSKNYGTRKLSTIHQADSNIEGPELVIYRGELMSPRRKIKKSETSHRRSESCPPRLMEQNRVQYSPAETLEAIQDILAVPILARESRIRKKCSSNNLFGCTDHFPNKTTMWGEGMPIDFNALSKAVPESSDEISPPPEQSKLWVVLDVDECLIHSNFCTVGAGKRYRQMEARPDKLSQVNTIFVDTEDGEAILVNQRPGLIRFLEAVAAEFNVVAFTAGRECYASQVLDAVDPNNRIFTQRLFRQHCHAAKGGIFVKDLRCVQGLDLSRAVLVDNSPLSFIFQPNNGILVSSWFDDAEDTALNSVLQLLHYLATEDDVRHVLRDLFGLVTILKSYRAYVGRDSSGSLNDLESWEDWPSTNSVQGQSDAEGTEVSTSTLEFSDDLRSSEHSGFDTDSLNLNGLNSEASVSTAGDLDDFEPPFGDTLTLVSHLSLPA